MSTWELVVPSAPPRAPALPQRLDQVGLDLVDLQIRAGVDLATHYYRCGRPGRGSYELARLAMRVNRLLAVRPDWQATS